MKTVLEEEEDDGEEGEELEGEEDEHATEAPRLPRQVVLHVVETLVAAVVCNKRTSVTASQRV